MEYLVTSNTNILYTGNKPTFPISGRKEVTDTTLGTTQLQNLVENCMYLMEHHFGSQIHSLQN